MTLIAPPPTFVAAFTCTTIFQDCRDTTGYCVDNDWKDACKPEKDAFKHCVDGK